MVEHTPRGSRSSTRGSRRAQPRSRPWGGASRGTSTREGAPCPNSGAARGKHSRVDATWTAAFCCGRGPITSSCGAHALAGCGGRRGALRCAPRSPACESAKGGRGVGACWAAHAATQLEQPLRGHRGPHPARASTPPGRDGWVHSNGGYCARYSGGRGAGLSGAISELSRPPRRCADRLRPPRRAEDMPPAHQTAP